MFAKNVHSEKKQNSSLAPISKQNRAKLAPDPGHFSFLKTDFLIVWLENRKRSNGCSPLLRFAPSGSALETNCPF